MKSFHVLAHLKFQTLWHVFVPKTPVSIAFLPSSNHLFVYKPLPLSLIPKSHLSPSRPPVLSPLLPTPPPPQTYSLAFSPTVPTFNFAAYFFNTLSLWYFQNCFVASLPATLLSIFAPPGCSSTKSTRFPSVLFNCGRVLGVARVETLGGDGGLNGEGKGGSGNRKRKGRE